QVQHRVGQFRVIAAAFVLEPTHIISQHDPKRLDAGKPLSEVLTMSLDRRSQRPKVHPVRPNADRTAPAAGAEGEDLVEAVEQPSPLLLANQPLELRPVP